MSAVDGADGGVRLSACCCIPSGLY